MNLSAHFTLEEFTRSGKALVLGIDNTPPPELMPRLIRAAEMLERIRAHLGGKPITITSGYRCERLNRAVGSKSTSDHPQGHAVDFVCPAYGSPADVAAELARVVLPLGIGQLIYEGVGGKAWVHASTHQPENQVNRIITITDAGTVAGIRP